MSSDARFSHRLQFALYRGVEGILSVLPWSTLVEAGRILGTLFWLVDRRHRRVVRDSLRGTDLGLDEAEIRRLSRQCFAHFGAVFLTSIRLYRADPEEVARRVKVEGQEHYDAARAMGPGIIQVSGHHGNWEALGLGQSLAGRPTAGIARPIRNPLMDQLLNSYRCRFGNSVISKGGAVQKALRMLREGGCVGFIVDQDALTSGIWVKFLGKWASTYPTAGNLAVRLDLPILPSFSWPEEDGSYRVRFDPPFKVPASGDLERDTWVATQLITDCLSREVHRDPRWYFWMHNRFKTRPGEGNPLPAPLPDPAWALSLPAPP
ncbi:MAG: lysophospholipid acyltransferase family protein [Acidobacteria bacterium]|nr:lysophospholipid acyltransferase family protein [Acidobacteriota bacterium]